MVIKRRIDILVYGLVALLAAYLLFNTLGLDLFVNRISELGDSSSSGFARFVGGFYLFNQYLWPDTANALFGMGAGAMDRFADQAHFAVAAVTWVKVLFEYGLVGAAAYFAFQYFCLFNNRGPLVVKLAAAVMLQLNGSLVPFAHALVFALLIWPPAGEMPQPRDRGNTRTSRAPAIVEAA